ncbi:MAG: serine hydrolase domain-containing protein [Massilia sp.]
MYASFATMFRRLLMLASTVLLTACASAPPTVQFDAARLAEVDGAISALVARHATPGAQFHLERDGAVFERSYGNISYGQPEPITADTLFDVASLSKVLATAPSVLLLAEEGKLDLEAPLARYLPECGSRGRDGITVRHLLTHSSGFPAGLPARPAWEGRAAALALACGIDPTDPPGTLFRYSDINYILLGIIVEQVSGQSLDRFAAERIFTPLKMTQTGFLPLQRYSAARIAPTQFSPEGELLQGVVHDPTARRMGGVAGSAGVFSTTRDIARFVRMLLAGGELDGVRVLSPDSVRLLTTVQSPLGLAQRAMGMDIGSSFARPRGTIFPAGSYGHTGYTGCFLWIDPTSRTFDIFLSNRVYPDDKSIILPFYVELGTLAARAAGLPDRPQ